MMKALRSRQIENGSSSGFWSFNAILTPSAGILMPKENFMKKTVWTAVFSFLLVAASAGSVLATALLADVGGDNERLLPIGEGLRNGSRNLCRRGAGGRDPAGNRPARSGRFRAGRGRLDTKNSVRGSGADHGRYGRIVRNVSGSGCERVLLWGGGGQDAAGYWKSESMVTRKSARLSMKSGLNKRLPDLRMR